MPEKIGPTQAMTFHRAICAGCEEPPDLDGYEFQATPEEAIKAATEDDFVEQPDGTLLCPTCQEDSTDAPQVRSKPPHRAEPRPENPYIGHTHEGGCGGCVAAWDEGFVARQPEIDGLTAAFDAVVAERDEMIRVSAANIAATQRNMDALRAHTLGAHDRPLCCGCDDDA